MKDRWKSDYDRRQYRLMIEQIDLFNEGKMALSSLVPGLNGLVSALEIPEPSWKAAFINEWGILEIVYAMALDRLNNGSTDGCGEIHLTADELDLVQKSVKNLQRIILSRPTVQSAPPL